MVDLNGDVLSLLKKVYSLQEERVYTYRLFEEGHKIYLSTAPNYDFVRFKTLVHDITQEFKRISQAIITIEHRLRNEFGCDHLAQYIASLQEDEKYKLELTAKLQLAKQDMIDHPDEEKNFQKVVELKQKLREVVDRINQSLGDLRYEMDG